MINIKTSASNDVIAFVTVLYNCEKFLPEFFRSFEQQVDSSFCLIVVDNASKDQSLAVARNYAERIGLRCHFIANQSNLGVAEANNQGIIAALNEGIDHIVLINNDVSFSPELVAQIRRYAIGGVFCAWTCMALLGDSENRWYGGGRLSYWRARGMHYSQNQSVRVQAPCAVSYAPTCLMYLHSSVIASVGLMDSAYFVYYDDTDFCRRMSDAGIALCYDPRVSFRHYVGGSSGGEFSEFSMRINTRNKFLYIEKHYHGFHHLIVTGLALISKIVQMIDGRRRRAIWLGLSDAFAPRKK